MCYEASSFHAQDTMFAQNEASLAYRYSRREWVGTTAVPPRFRVDGTEKRIVYLHREEPGASSHTRKRLSHARGAVVPSVFCHHYAQCATSHHCARVCDFPSLRTVCVDSSLRTRVRHSIIASFCVMSCEPFVYLPHSSLPPASSLPPRSLPLRMKPLSFSRCSRSSRARRL